MICTLKSNITITRNYFDIDGFKKKGIRKYLILVMWNKTSIKITELKWKIILFCEIYFWTLHLSIISKLYKRMLIKRETKNKTNLSLLPDASNKSEGWNSTMLTESLCSESSVNNFPAVRSQIWINKKNLGIERNKKKKKKF